MRIINRVKKMICEPEDPWEGFSENETLWNAFKCCFKESFRSIPRDDPGRLEKLSMRLQILVVIVQLLLLISILSRAVVYLVHRW